MARRPLALAAAAGALLLLAAVTAASAFVVVPAAQPRGWRPLRPSTWMAAAASDGADGGSPSPSRSPPPRIDVDGLTEDIYDRARPPPLLVTIGPQCGGKTSLLRRLNATRPSGAPPLVDVAIDDDRDVYRRMPLRAFLEGELGGPKDVRIRGRLASERCRDPGPEECRLVLGFLAGLWSLEEAEEGLAALPSTTDVLPALLASLPKAAEAFQDSINARARAGKGRAYEEGEDAVHAMGTRFYSLFVPEAIPRAVKASNQRLSAALRDHLGPVAWGNTNAKAADFKGALRAAEAYGRRAILLRWGLEMDRVSLEELLVRNTLRATRLGRYIPAVSIKMALERTEGLLSRSGGGEPRALMTMAGFTADVQGRPRSNIPPPDEAEPLVRPFAGLDARRERGAAPFTSSAAASLDLVGTGCVDTATWGRGANRGPRPGPPALGEGPRAQRGGGRQSGGDDEFIVATGVGAGASVAIGVSGGSRAARTEAATRALFVRGARQLNRALERLLEASSAALGLGPLLVLRMGEWSKFKYWSKAAYDMDWEWRRDYQRARNQTLRDREEMMRTNGTDPWAVRDRFFDFELWTILRTLSGQNGNNRF